MLHHMKRSYWRVFGIASGVFTDCLEFRVPVADHDVALERGIDTCR